MHEYERVYNPAYDGWGMVKIRSILRRSYLMNGDAVRMATSSSVK